VSVRRHACITVACDVCGHPFRDLYGGGDVHFADLGQARVELERDGWLMTADDRVVCPVDSAKHQAERAALDSGAQR
jgi:hypothetical protein